MNDILSEYFTLSSTKSVDKGNGVAIFCAIVSIVACSYSLNLTTRATSNRPTSSAQVESIADETQGQDINARPASHQNK